MIEVKDWDENTLKHFKYDLPGDVHSIEFKFERGQFILYINDEMIIKDVVKKDDFNIIVQD